MPKYIVKSPFTETSMPYKAGDEIELTPERAAQLGDLVEPKPLDQKQIESSDLKHEVMTSTDLMNKKTKSVKKTK